jgi:lipoprotein NlpI
VRPPTILLLPLLALFAHLAFLPTRAAEVTRPEQLLQQAEETWKKGNRAEAIAMVTQVLLADPKHLNALALRGRYYYDLHQDAKALADFDAVIALDSRSPVLHQHRGWCRFRLGKFDDAIADFDMVIKLVPSREPEHWQRGIVYYYAKRFAEGKKQFELHQTVNPRDVENAVWHFLCTARLSGLDAARASLIPITGDARVPMTQVQSLFAGKATPQDVLKAAEAGEPRSPVRASQLFYAHLYLGLYYEAAGDDLKCREHIQKAVNEFPSDSLMGDVARVHAQVLKRRSK